MASLASSMSGERFMFKECQGHPDVPCGQMVVLVASETEGLVALRSMESMQHDPDFKSRDVRTFGRGRDGRERVVNPSS